jgi:uncharacterized LabA/DUF88 family protein
MTERIALFIDDGNLHYAARNLGFEVDFKRLLHEFSSFGSILRAFFYTTVKGDEGSNIRPLMDWLDYNGFTVRARPAKEYDDGGGRRKTRRSVGIELAIDALEMARHVDHVFLFSGDGDLRRVAEGVQRFGARVSVISSLRTNPPMIADDLRRQADSFIELDTIRKSIERSPHRRAPN